MFAERQASDPLPKLETCFGANGSGSLCRSLNWLGRSTSKASCWFRRWFDPRKHSCSMAMADRTDGLNWIPAPVRREQTTRTWKSGAARGRARRRTSRPRGGGADVRRDWQARILVDRVAAWSSGALRPRAREVEQWHQRRRARQRDDKWARLVNRVLLDEQVLQLVASAVGVGNLVIGCCLYLCFCAVRLVKPSREKLCDGCRQGGGDCSSCWKNGAYIGDLQWSVIFLLWDSHGVSTVSKWMVLPVGGCRGVYSKVGAGGRSCRW